MRLAYYYCADPTSKYEHFEIQEFVEMTSFCFIFVPHNTKPDEILRIGLQGKSRSCIWSVQNENDMEKIIEMFTEKTLTQERWKAMGAKRLAFNPIRLPVEEDDATKYMDWTTRTWITAEEIDSDTVNP